MLITALSAHWFFSTKGGTGPLCEGFLKSLEGMLAEKDHAEYSVVMAWLRCRIAFCAATECGDVHSWFTVTKRTSHTARSTTVCG